MAGTSDQVIEETIAVDKPEMGYVLVIAFLAALGGLLFGWDTGAIAGALPFLAKEFNMSPGAQELAVSAILFGTIIGAIFGGRFADYVGRRMALLIMSIIFAVGAILASIAWNYGSFFVFRVVLGLAVGGASLVTPVFIAEMSPPSVRGALVTLNSLAIVIGEAVAFWVDLAFAAGGAGWRPMFAIAFVPAAILFVGMLFVKDTPRWYASKGRWDEAHAVLERSIGSPERREEELRGIRRSLAEEKRVSIGDLFAPGLRWAVVTGVGLAIFQQFLGINTVIYYAPTIFQFAGFKSATTAILATAIVGMVSIIGTLLSIFIVEKLGRKLLLYIGIACVLITLAGIGTVFFIDPKRIATLVLILVLLYIFAFQASIGPVVWLMIAEVFPNRLRGYGASMACTAVWIANLIVSITFLSFVNNAGAASAFWTYAFLALLALIFVRFFVPETKGKTLEQIEWYWRSGKKWVPESEIAGKLPGTDATATG